MQRQAKRCTGAAAALMRVLAVLLIAACSSCGGGASPPAGHDRETASGRPASSLLESTAGSDAEALGPGSGFRIDRVPISDAPLGAFPYFSLPNGYRELNPPQIREYDRFPFWTGDRYEWVEGRIYFGNFGAEGDKSFSRLEVARNIESLVERAGGRKIFDGRIPEAALAELQDGVAVEYVDGLGDIYSAPTQTFVVRRADRTIWIHLCAHGYGGGWAIAESTAFQPTASLLPAGELQRRIETEGKAAIHLHFATDSAEILPDSLPQIEQIRSLLEQEPDLKLEVNGHTDDTGDAAHNRVLSLARARSVVNALSAAGIDADRLKAQGFGADQPVADNSTDEGRALNRRVELVRM